MRSDLCENIRASCVYFVSSSNDSWTGVPTERSIRLDSSGTMQLYSATQTVHYAFYSLPSPSFVQTLYKDKTAAMTNPLPAVHAFLLPSLLAPFLDTQRAPRPN